MSYSQTINGELGTDGQLRDIHGNVVSSGLDSETRAALEDSLKPREVRVLPSERDVYAASKDAGGDVSHEATIVKPSESEAARVEAFVPGYNVTAPETVAEPTFEPANG